MDPHKKSEDEAIAISKIHYHINNNTLSGQKIKEAFKKDLPNEPIFIGSKESGATRSTHHDLQLIMNLDPLTLKNVEYKGSCEFKLINNNRKPWDYGVQFLNGSGNKFSIGIDYAICFYNVYIDKIIEHFNIQTPKPSFEEWSKDAFRQGKPKTEFVKELREKGYKSTYLSQFRKEINKNFIASNEQLDKLMVEVENIANKALNCKDYWLQIHGNIDDPEYFNVKWTNKINMPEIISREQVISKQYSDINFKFICSDNSVFYAKLRWGYGQCISNIRIDIK